MKKMVEIHNIGNEYYYYLDGKKRGGFFTREKAQEDAKEQNRAKYAGGQKKVATGNAPTVSDDINIGNTKLTDTKRLTKMDWEIILKRMSCPRATEDLKLNTKNRNSAIKDKDIKYGPLNIDEPADYWQKVADHWDTSVEAAKKSKCSNCVAFDISPRMKECMPLEDIKGGLGYCWMHDFKCHEDRTCYTWAKGGPITKDEKSKKNQMKREGKK